MAWQQRRVRWTTEVGHRVPQEKIERERLETGNDGQGKDLFI